MQERPPLVSIVLPTCNGSRYLRQSVDSCLNQTHRDIELIVVDDGSTDGTADIIGSYTDRRVTCVRHGKNRGLPEALNTGFGIASGKFMTWTSDDNYYVPEAIEKMLRYLAGGACEFVYCDFFAFRGDDPASSVLRRPPDSPLADSNTIGSCFLYTSRVRDTVGKYDAGAVLAEDYDYWLRVSKKFRMGHLPEALYYYRLHDRSLTSCFFRNYEVQVATLLVRFRNGAIDMTAAGRSLLALALKKKLAGHKPAAALTGILMSSTGNRIDLYNAAYPYYRHKYGRRIDNMLQRVYDGKISVNCARTEFNDMIRA